MTRILFVCSGNTCRSPMAEAIARDVAEKPPFDTLDIQFGSAGAAAPDGAPATPEAVTAVRNMGMEMHDHRSRAITRGSIDASDIIFGLTPAHVQEVIALAPDAADRTHLLDPRGRSVPDPIGMSQAVYDQTADFIRAAVVDRLSEHLETTRQSS